jgi:hypothetical protein
MDSSVTENFEMAIIPDWHKKVNIFFSEITWIIMAFLMVPTVLIILAQNSVPGDSTYVIKTGLESASLAIVKIFNKQAGFQIDYTERRYQEAMQVLASKYGAKSMDALFEQIVSTEDSIKGVDNPEERRQLTEKYINTLLEVNSGLESKKLEITSNQSLAKIYPTLTPMQYLPTPTPDSSATSYSSPTSMPAPASNPQTNSSSTEITTKIDDTQKQIEETIKQLEINNSQTLIEAPTPTVLPTILPTVRPTNPPAPTPTKSPFYHRSSIDPTAVPTAAAAPTSIPATAVPPTSVPATSVPAPTTLTPKK